MQLPGKPFAILKSETTRSAFTSGPVRHVNVPLSPENKQLLPLALRIGAEKVEVARSPRITLAGKLQSYVQQIDQNTSSCVGYVLEASLRRWGRSFCNFQ
jgi:hypothetical protein